MAGEVANKSITVVCRFCQERVELQTDTPKARAAGEGPHQQLRQHFESHLIDAIRLGRRAGWLLDMLCFNCPDGPERWRNNLIAVLDWLMQKAI